MAASSTANSELLIFCRRPAPWRSKTRLAAVIGDDATVSIYRAFVTDLFETAGRVNADIVRVCYVSELDEGGATNETVEAALSEIQDDAGTAFPLESQSAGDLGVRMASALAGAFARGAQAAAIIGTDSPQMGASYIDRAFELLAGSAGPRVVIGPSADGGYVLVGARRPLPPELFSGIPWSTDQVLPCTLEALNAASVSAHLLPESFDVDTAADLARLAGAIESLRAAGRPYPRRTADALARIRDMPGAESSSHA